MASTLAEAQRDAAALINDLGALLTDLLGDTGPPEASQQALESSGRYWAAYAGLRQRANEPLTLALLALTKSGERGRMDPLRDDLGLAHCLGPREGRIWTQAAQGRRPISRANPAWRVTLLPAKKRRPPRPTRSSISLAPTRPPSTHLNNRQVDTAQRAARRRGDASQVRTLTTAIVFSQFAVLSTRPPCHGGFSHTVRLSTPARPSTNPVAHTPSNAATSPKPRASCV